MIAILLLCGAAQAQVLSPLELHDKSARELQQKYFRDLKALASDAKDVRYPYKFCFSRFLDLEQKQQDAVDQRSIRFESYKGRMVLAMSGNYYAAYSDQLMDRRERAWRTFTDVTLPLLRAGVQHLPGDAGFDAYAIELSHHVIRKVLGIETEAAENIMLIASRDVATRLVMARSRAEQEAVFDDVEVYVDGKPFAMVFGHEPGEGSEAVQAAAAKSAHAPVQLASLRGPMEASVPGAPAVAPAAVQASDIPEITRHQVTPEMLATLRTERQDVVTRLVRDLDAQAHFVSYAPPAFIEFHGGAYLQLSMTTSLEASSAGSRYKLAALAFDEHIVHLVRPAAAYFPEGQSGVDGIDFSTSVKVAGSQDAVSVEFVLPLAALRSFARYDLTGQQLVNAGWVLINGERATLDLQMAESR